MCKQRKAREAAKWWEKQLEEKRIAQEAVKPIQGDGMDES